MRETKTDLERLRQVQAGEITHRGCGKTYAMCYEVVSAILDGDTDVMVAMGQYSHSSYIAPMLVDILEERGLGAPVKRSQWEWQLEGGAVIRFAGLDIKRKLMGSNATVLGVW